MSGELTEPAEEPSRRPVVSPLVDTGPHGLYSFNLGSIPASVTPPRSWRRAAWFMIFVSAAALAGLLIMTASLVQPAQVADRINNIPELPTGPQIGLPPSTPDTTARASLTGRATQAPEPGDPGRPRLTPVAVVSSLTGAASTTSAADSGSSSSGDGGISSILPDTTPLTVVTGSGPVSADPGVLAARTQTFFKEVTSNVSAAADMTSGTVRDDAAALIQQRYGEISAIQVQSISLDPNRGVTVSMLKVTDKDGSTSSEQTTLRFTLGTDPKIQNPGG